MTCDPLSLLPPGMTLDYLRRLVNVEPTWNIIVLYDSAMDTIFAAQLAYDHVTHSAMIYVNEHYHFSPAALAKTLAHELMELAMVDTWLVFKEGIPKSQQGAELERRYRFARDKQINHRLDSMPFWGAYDVPIPRS